MKKREHDKKQVSFNEAIFMALNTPKLTRKQIDQLHKEANAKIKKTEGR